MNLANKITVSRIILSIIILIILLFPWHQVGIDMPTYLVKGNIVVDLKYIIAGVLFIIASLTDFFDGRIARKYNMVTDFGKMVDAISDKLLTNTLIIVLACANLVHPVIAVIIIGRDIIVDSIKMLIGNKGKAVAAIGVAKVKTASLMCGLTLKLFYDMPFSLVLPQVRISDYLLILAAVLSIVSGAKYYMMAKDYITEK
jgi:CDP-diacylglycerol--glycerol-3-phosphate 3-phosphatidyltransferase